MKLLSYLPHDEEASKPTLWEVPDDLWHRMEKLIEQRDPPKATGRPWEDACRLLNALIFHFSDELSVESDSTGLWR